MLMGFKQGRIAGSSRVEEKKRRERVCVCGRGERFCAERVLV